MANGPQVDEAECMIYAVSRVRRPIAEDKAIAKTVELLKVGPACGAGLHRYTHMLPCSA